MQGTTTAALSRVYMKIRKKYKNTYYYAFRQLRKRIHILIKRFTKLYNYYIIDLRG